MSTFMEEVYDNSEDATEKDLEEYSKYNKKESENIKTKFLYLNEQKLLMKNYVLETVKDTPLFPYVLIMEHLIGVIEGIQLTDDPIKLLSRYFFPKIDTSILQSPTDNFLDAKAVSLGVNDLFNTNYSPNDILNFNVFRLQTKLSSNDVNNLPVFVNSYLFIKIGDNPEDNYFMFSEVQNRLLNQNITMELLERNSEIKQIKEIINNKEKIMTLMEKLIAEIDTKNSWGKNQLTETTINIYKGTNVSNNELIVFSNFIATIQTKNSWGKNDAKFALLNLLAKQI